MSPARTAIARASPSPSTRVPAPVTLDGLVDAFLAGRNERTLRAYRQDLEDFRAVLGAVDVRTAAQLLLSRGHGAANGLALSFKASMVDRKLSAATINRRLSALRSLVSAARTLGLVPWALEVRGARAESYRDTRGPGRSAVERMLGDLAPRHDRKARRDRALVRLVYDLGLRRGEAASLDVADVDLATGRVLVLGKGRRAKVPLELAPATKAALAAWLQVRGTEPGPLFTNVDRAGKGLRLTGTSVYRVIRELGRRAGAGHVRPHGLRHTAITEAVKAAQAHGIGLEEVLQFSRHSDVRTLLVYRDQERNVQGRLAQLVAASVEG